MAISRRGFLKGLLAGTAIIGAPAIVRSESLMKLWVPPKEIYEPLNWDNMVWSPEVVQVIPTTISDQMASLGRDYDGDYYPSEYEKQVMLNNAAIKELLKQKEVFNIFASSKRL